MDEITPKEQFLKYLDNKFQEVVDEFKRILEAKATIKDELINSEEVKRILQISISTVVRLFILRTIIYRRIK